MRGLLTLEQVIAGILEQTVDVEGDEELRSQRVSVQVGCQGEGNLQHGHQQEAAGRRLPVPALHLERRDRGGTSACLHRRMDSDLI